MFTNFRTDLMAYFSEFPWEIAGFFLFMALMLAFLLWAIYARPEDNLDRGIRHPWSDDPDDLTAALNFERKQAAMGRAIRGERK